MTEIKKRKIKIEQLRKDKEWIQKHGKSLIGICFLLCFLQYWLRGLCTLRLFCGLPCPSCGMTRAALLFFQGHIRESIQMHPLWLFVLFGLFFIVYHRYVGLKHKALLYFYGGALVIAFFAVYLYRMKYYFPMEDPMVYYKDNFLFYLYRIAGGKT